MPDAHYFRSPYPERATQRKRVLDDDEEEEHDGQAVVSIDDDEESDDLLKNAPPDFPHAPVKRQKPPEAVNDEPVEKRRNTKKQHLAVLTTMLYKCMLDGDYVRAGRAFSILLRLESRGKKPDLRIHGLWNIGAELLLRKNTSLTDEFADSLTFTQEGFKAARSYYDRLILQFPYKRTAPHLVSQLHFNLAMFGTWILQIQDRSHSAMKAIEEGQSAEDVVIEYDLYTADDNISGNSDGYIAIKTWELEEARTIQTRIHQLTIKPPHDKDAPLIELSGMVSLWVMDLMKALDQPDSEIAAQRTLASNNFRMAKQGGATVWKEVDVDVGVNVDVDMDDYVPQQFIYPSQVNSNALEAEAEAELDPEI